MLCLSSCGGGGNGTGAFTRADFGTTKTVPVHQPIILELRENPTTGFTWHQSWAPEAALRLAQDNYLPDRPQLAGSGGTRQFVYEALAAGQVTITVQYGRWWDGGERQDPQTITLDIQ